VCEDPNLEHRCSHKCVHVAHRKYKCECYPGYVLAEDGLTCISMFDLFNQPYYL